LKCARMADCAQMVPVKTIEVGCVFGGGDFEVLVTDDIMPVENRPGFVSEDHHCHPFGHS
jgi:hypothetical protein